MATKRRAGGALQRDLEQVQWRSIFSRNAIKSYINSAQFMRKLTVIALSTITHVRNILPSECFKTHLFGGLHLKIIQEKTSTEKSNFIASSLQAALEAFDKRYLHQIALCLYEDESKPETLLESYIFTFNYTENSASVSLESNSQNTHSSFDDIKMSTKQLLNNITAMSQELKRDLPPDYDMTFHLYYYEDVTPVGYNPPGFEHVSGEQDPLEPYTDELQMFGKVKTAFHKMNLKVFNNEITPAVVPLDESVGTSASVSTNNYSVRCPCLVCPSSKDYVQCISCNTAQHPACFGLTRDDIEAIKSHVCDECALKNPQLDCTDPKLVLMDKKNKKNLCISRRVLLWCLGVLYLSEERLKETFQISISRTRMLMKHLESKEVFYPLPPGEENTSLTERKVHKHALRMIIPEYFPRKERNDMLDLSKLLLEEINVTPQDYTEMNELLRMPNTLTLGKVTNKPAVKRSEDDVSMFREVLTGDVDDEEDQMPLSGPHNPVQEKEAGKGKARGAKRKAEVPPATYRTRRSKQTAK